MRLLAVIITVLAAACSDERGLPQGFLEQAAQTRPETGSTASATPTPQPDADLPLGTDAASAPAPGGASEPSILTGQAADDPDSVAEADCATAALVAGVTKDLKLGPADAVATPAGDAPHQKLAQDRRFDAFRAECAHYHQLRKALLPYGKRLADGAATPDERRQHDRIEAAAKAEQQRLSRMMWRGGLTADDRAAMSWIMFGPTAAVPKRAP